MFQVVAKILKNFNPNFHFLKKKKKKKKKKTHGNKFQLIGNKP
jgi:hypothetical protein